MSGTSKSKSRTSFSSDEEALAATAAIAESVAEGVLTDRPKNDPTLIRDVWDYNFKDEAKLIRFLVKHYHYVAMDTEFPGIVVKPVNLSKRRRIQRNYQLLRCNVDLLKLIQLGITLMDKNGRTPVGPYITWQFNFKFDIDIDMFASTSIALLKRSGIQFDEHKKHGIEPVDFAEFLMVSGIVLEERVKWVSFHAGYDFGYLMKMLMNKRLPSEEAEFLELLKIYFPNVYDIKHLMAHHHNVKGGLQALSYKLRVERIGQQHQAGSDALLTGNCFFKMKKTLFDDHIDEADIGHLFGYGAHYRDFEPFYN